MRIPISYPSENGKNIWVILDFQGVIETADGVPDGIPIGRIEFKSNGDPTLTIGNHLLEGKRSHLKQPFALLEKKPQTESIEENSEVDENDRSYQGYQVVAIIREKFVFKNRPKPIVLV